MLRNMFFIIHACISILAAGWLLAFFLFTGSEYASIPFSVIAVVAAVSIISFLLWHSGRRLSAFLVLASLDCLGLVFCIFIFGPTAPFTITLFCISVATAFMLLGTQPGLVVMFTSLLIASLNHKSSLEWVMVLAALALIALIFALEYRKTRNLRRSMLAEIEHERTTLDARVAHRVDAIRKADADRMKETDRITEFGKISAGLFHDLMNPLSALTNNITHLSKLEMPRQDLDDLAEQSVEAAKRVRHILDRIRQILHTTDTVSNFSPLGAVREIVDLYTYMIRTNDIELSITIPETLRISGPRDVFLQIMMNVISNSIEALTGRPDPKTLTISTHASLSYIWIHVSDSGIGMPKEIQEKIGNTPVTTKPFGSGVGLYRSRQLLADEFNGEMLIESSDGKGTIVSLKIPLQEPQA